MVSRYHKLLGTECLTRRYYQPLLRKGALAPKTGRQRPAEMKFNASPIITSHETGNYISYYKQHQQQFISNPMHTNNIAHNSFLIRYYRSEDMLCFAIFSHFGYLYSHESSVVTQLYLTSFISLNHHRSFLIILLGFEPKFPNNMRLK